MAIKDDRLKDFFSKQKVGAFNSLVQKGKPIAQKESVIEPEPIKHFSESIKITNSELIVEEVTLPKTVPINTPSIIPNNNEIDQNIIEHLSNVELLTNREQSVSESLSNRDQSVNEPLAISEQAVSNTLAKSMHIVSEPSPQPLANTLANEAEIQVDDLMLFSKKERELLSLVFWQCRNNGTLVSPPITTEEIRNTLKITADRVRNLIFRIIKKGGLKIVKHKNGQTAYRVFELPKSVYQAMIDFQNNTVHRFIDPLANTLAQPLAKSIYSSSNNLNINTTTSLPEEWKKINFNLLEHIGFSETQLRQLHDSNTTMPEIVQDSINRFAYSLQYNDKTKIYSEPLSVLMGVLRKGQKWVEPNYVPPKELALRQMLEEKRKHKEQQELMIKELIELEFPEWRKKLTEAEINNIVPESIRKTNIGAAIQASLRTFFIETVLQPRLEAI